MSHSKTDVVIIGAGPTGLMAANLLLQSGIKFRILDKSEQQAHETRAFILHARSLELLQKIGLVDEFLKRGVMAPGVQIFTRKGLAAQVDLDDVAANHTPYPFLFMCPQSEIEKILAENLEKNGIRVEHSTEVVDLSQEQDKVIINIKDTIGDIQTLEAAYVIGADGAHSIARKQLGLDFSGGSYIQTFMLADCSIDWPLDYAHIKIFLKKRSLALYFPLKENMGRIFAIKPFSTEQDSEVEKKATTAIPVSLEEVHKAFDEASYIKAQFSDPIWASRYRIHHRSVSQYSVGRIFLAGDAAHIHSPVGGQGMNTGLQDAANLTWKIVLALKAGKNIPLLNSYNAERKRIGEKLLAYTDRMFTIISSQNIWIDSIRNFLFPRILKIVSNHRKLRIKVFHFVSQLGIHYHGDAFLMNYFSEKGNKYFPKNLRAGYRAPNAVISRKVDVFELIQGYQFDLLVLARRPLSREEITEISEEINKLSSETFFPMKTHFIAHSITGSNNKIIQPELNEIFENYGLSRKITQGIFLIRPDGYFAYCSDILDFSKLKGFLARFSEK